MAKPGPETRLATKMDKAAAEKYGPRLKSVNQHGGRFSATGVSDRLLCLDGVFVAIEIKAPESYPVKGQPNVEKALAKGPTVKQREFIRKVNEAGGVGGFAATIEQYMALLDEAARKAKKRDKKRKKVK